MIRGILALTSMDGIPATASHAPSPTTGPGESRGILRRTLQSTAPFLLVAGLIAVRFPTPLFRAEFWAEDATEFFFDAILLGARSLLLPVYGYQFLLERTVAFGATALPVFWTPYIYAWSCLVVNAATLAYVTRDGFAWIAPERWQRILLALLLALAPGTGEVFLNLANMPGTLALLGFLILVERPFRMGVPKILLLAVITLSAGHVVLWLPVTAYLAWSQRSRGYAVAAGVIVCVALLNSVGTHHASMQVGSLDYRLLTEVPWILIENAFARLLIAPFLGFNLAEFFQIVPGSLYWPVLAVALASVAVLATREGNRDRDGNAVLLLGCCGAIGMLGVIAVFRAYNVGTLLRESGNLLASGRYSFLPASLATLMWTFWLLPPRPSNSLSKVLRVTAMGLLVLQLASGFRLIPDRPDLRWPERSARVQALLDLNRHAGKSVVITMSDLPIHPWGWTPDNRRVAVRLPGR